MSSKYSMRSHRSAGALSRSSRSSRKSQGRVSQAWRKVSTVVTAANKFKKEGKRRKVRIRIDREKRKRILAEKVCSAVAATCTLVGAHDRPMRVAETPHRTTTTSRFNGMLERGV